jgi:hypothetical protein
VKIVFSFISGMVACSLLFFGVSLVLPTQAATVDESSVSTNTTNGLAKLIPDIQKIYHESLTMPYKQAESQIYDKDIAEYYRALMNKTGLAPQE